MASGRAIFVMILILIGIGLMAGIFFFMPSESDDLMPTGNFYGEKIMLNLSFEEQQECSTDAECVPVPGCHAKKCMNSVFSYMHRKDVICDTLKEKGSAYTAEDCGCSQGKCVNKNMH